MLSKEFRIRLNNSASSKVFHEPEQMIKWYREQLIRSEEQMKNILENQKQIKKQRLNTAFIRYSHALDRGVQQAQQHIDECSMIMKQQIKQKMKTEEKENSQIK